jgi:hypothetical protein
MPKLTPEKGTFTILQGKPDGYPLFAIVDMGLRDFGEKEKLPFFLTVCTRLVNSPKDGLPTAGEADELNAWEDTVEARLRPQGRFVFVGRVTWKGQRELLFHVDNQQPFIDALAALYCARSTRPFAFRCERDSGWTKASYWLKNQ